MDIIISNAKELVDNGSQLSISAALQYVLNEGIFGIEGTQGGSTLNIASFEKLVTLSNIPETIVSGEGTCCPDCNIYYLGNILRFLQYAETYGGPFNCCLNTFIGVEPRIVLQESIGALPQTCCNNFNSCINEILSLHKNDCYDCEDNFLNQIESILGGAGLLEGGIVEYGTINGRSLLCDLITALKTNGLIEAGGDQCLTLDILRYILGIGIFVWCEKTCNLATEDNEPILTENSENIQPELCPEETTTTTTTTINGTCCTPAVVWNSSQSGDGGSLLEFGYGVGIDCLACSSIIIQFSTDNINFSNGPQIACQGNYFFDWGGAGIPFNSTYYVRVYIECDENGSIVSDFSQSIEVTAF